VGLGWLGWLVSFRTVMTSGIWSAR
jgi:hypothetical protein